MSGNKERVVQTEEEEHMFRAPPDGLVDWEAIRDLDEQPVRRLERTLKIDWNNVLKGFGYGLAAILLIMSFVYFTALPIPSFFIATVEEGIFVAMLYAIISVFMFLEAASYISKSVRRGRRRRRYQWQRVGPRRARRYRRRRRR